MGRVWWIGCHVVVIEESNWPIFAPCCLIFKPFFPMSATCWIYAGPILESGCTNLVQKSLSKKLQKQAVLEQKMALRAHFVACWSHVWSSGPHLGTCLMNVGAIGPHGGSWPPGGPMLGPYWSPVGPRRKVSFQKPSRTRDSRATKRSPPAKAVQRLPPSYLPPPSHRASNKGCTNLPRYLHQASANAQLSSAFIDRLESQEAALQRPVVEGRLVGSHFGTRFICGVSQNRECQLILLVVSQNRGPQSYGWFSTVND